MSKRPWGIKPSTLKRVLAEVREKGGVREIQFDGDGGFTIVFPDKPETTVTPRDTKLQQRELV